MKIRKIQILPLLCVLGIVTSQFAQASKWKLVPHAQSRAFNLVETDSGRFQANGSLEFQYDNRPYLTISLEGNGQDSVQVLINSNSYPKEKEKFFDIVHSIGESAGDEVFCEKHSYLSRDRRGAWWDVKHLKVYQFNLSSQENKVKFITFLRNHLAPAAELSGEVVDQIETALGRLLISEWSSEAHGQFDARTRQSISTALILSQAHDLNGRSNYPNAQLRRLPLELLFKVFTDATE